MSEPINLPPLTMKVLMEVFGSHADIPPALLSTSWKDGIDIDVTSMRAQMLVEAYAGLAVEQATAELRAERDADRRREYGYSQETVDAITRERDALQQIVADYPPIEAELREVSDRAFRAEAERDALRAKLIVAEEAAHMTYYSGFP